MKGVYIMYYKDCTKNYAVEVIKEILEYAEPRRALELVAQFLDNQINTDEIGNEF